MGSKFHRTGLAFIRSALTSMIRSSTIVNPTRSYTLSSRYHRMEELRSNPFYDKYADKISTLQKNSEDVLNQRLVENSKRKQSKIPSDSKQPVIQTPKPIQDQLATSKAKKLDDILKLDLIRDKSAEEIVEIWKKYHEKEGCIGAIIQDSKYGVMEKRRQLYNTFLFPLPRDEGYEFIVCQFQRNECHFASLINYQTYKENAPECLTLVHYPELSSTKGIVLMKGEYNKEVINALEARCLVNQLQLFYASEDPHKTTLLKAFTNDPDRFDHNDLIAELQNSFVFDDAKMQI